MYRGIFECYVRDIDDRNVHFKVECEKVLREDCVLVQDTLLKSSTITLCTASIINLQEDGEIFCDTCGSQLVFKTSVGPMASSDYIGSSTCIDCQTEYCQTTNCLKCDIGKYPDCQFAYLKRQ